MKVRNLMRGLVWVMPASRLKNGMLRFLGHMVDREARVGPNLVWHVEEFTVGPHGRVAAWNLFRHLRSVTVGAGARIGRMNVVTSHPVYVRLYSDGASLLLGNNSKVTSRHTLDCSGGIELHAYSSLAGRQSLLLSHSVDLERNAQMALPITVGERSFVGARCLLLPGSKLPARSVLGAGSVLPRRLRDKEAGVWAGVPAVWRGPAVGLWFERAETSTNNVYVPKTDEIVKNAL